MFSPHSVLLLIGSAILLSSQNLTAQINYSEESAEFLAEQIAADHGVPLEDCLDLGWLLAESLSYLSTDEQIYVFGFEDSSQLAALPNGAQLKRPVRMAWGQKVDELDYDVSAASRPSPTQVDLLTPVAGLTGSGAFAPPVGGLSGVNEDPDDSSTVPTTIVRTTLASPRVEAAFSSGFPTYRVMSA